MSDYVDPKYFKKSTYSATGTIVGQFIAGVVSLVLGLGFIYLMTKWSGSWGIYWSDGNKHDFFTGYIAGPLGLTILIISVAEVHFDRILKKPDLFRWSIKASFYGGLFVAAFSGLLMLPDHNLKLFLAEIIYDLTLAVSFGVIVGGVQVARIQIEKFSPVKYEWLISNGADLYACKLGILPYRQQVYTFWGSFLAFILILTSVAIFMIAREDSKDTILPVLGISFGLFIFSLFLFLKTIGVFVSPDIKYVEGITTKTSVIYQTVTYKLTCNGRKFSTNSQTWHGVVQGAKYRLWYYSGVNNHVMAFERVTPSRSDNSYLYTDDSITDVTSVKDIEMRKLRSRNRNVPWLIGFGTIILTIFWKIIRRKPRK